MRLRGLKVARRTAQGRLSCEGLEARLMLTGTPPAVSAVVFGSTDWTASFLNDLSARGWGDGHGYAMPQGNNQLKNLPWSNLNQVHLKFTEDVNVDKADLTLNGVNDASYDIIDFIYDEVEHAATWTVAGYLNKDRIMIDLNGSGLGAVTDMDGNELDGDWGVGGHGGMAFPSGNGQAGTDFEYLFRPLQGDVNQGNLTNATDVALIQTVVPSQAGNPTYNPKYDINGDGLISTADVSLASAFNNQTTPYVPTYYYYNDSPQTAGLAAITVQENAPNQTVSMFAAFQDPESPDTDLDFDVVNVSNNSIFSSLTYDPNTGVLIVDFATTGTGDSVVTVRATDPSGNETYADLNVTVEPVNTAPEFVFPIGITYMGGTAWYFLGDVADAEESMAGKTVEFLYYLDGHSTTIDNLEHFGYLFYAPMSELGQAVGAKITDSQGVETEWVGFLVI
ncbi:MAG: hypothetical protein R3E01_30045 [Pirellulaceae bacterium]|nr:hypothetical protein [Planctomycetales bacterium]